MLAFLLIVSSVFARDFGVNGSVAFTFPPEQVRGAALDARDRETLDDDWIYVQTLYDADSTMPELWNAYPVGMTFSNGGRGYVATLHTVFGTTNYGASWFNMDPFPPPFSGGSFSVFRGSAFITSIDRRPVRRTAASADTFLVSTQRSDEDSGFVRGFSWNGFGWSVRSQPVMSARMWMSHVLLPDSHTAVALAGEWGRIFYNDSLGVDHFFDTLEYNFFGGFLAGAAERRDSLMIAVGSQQWISRDRGMTWATQPPADSLGDYGVSFSDSLHGFVGGGTLSPNNTGWVRRSEDGGRTWSGRILSTPFPIRAVQRVTDSVGWAAGGVFEEGTVGGGIWKTTDGGDTWNRELLAIAEIRALAVQRLSPAYFEVYAAGAFADYSAGVWKTRVFLPDTAGLGPVLYADPDSLDFGIIPAGSRDTLSAWIHNIGDLPVQLSALDTRGGRFLAVQELIGTNLAPGDSALLQVQFAPDTVGIYRTAPRLTNSWNQLVEVVCRGEAALATGTAPTSVPNKLALDIFPNPGNAEFTLKFTLPRAGDAVLRIFDITGRTVETLSLNHLASGEHTRIWNASDFASGIYFARVETNSATVTRKLLLLK